MRLWRARVCKGGERRRERTGEAVSWEPQGRGGPAEDETGKDP